MEHGLFANQGKKLAFVAILLLCVALLVGREEDPGLLASTQRDGMPPASALPDAVLSDPGLSDPGQPDAGAQVVPPPPAMQPPVQTVVPPSPADLAGGGDAAQAVSPEPAETVYVTGEELIDDASGYEPAPMLDPNPRG